jgi:hypothetical protein
MPDSDSLHHFCGNKLYYGVDENNLREQIQVTRIFLAHAQTAFRFRATFHLSCCQLVLHLPRRLTGPLAPHRAFVGHDPLSTGIQVDTIP